MKDSQSVCTIVQWG